MAASYECLSILEIFGQKSDYLSPFLTDTEKPEQNCKSGMLKCKGTVSTMKQIFK